MAAYDPITISRFWSKVDKRSDDECWVWRGTKAQKPNREGLAYGSYSAAGKSVRAHRFAFHVSTGVDPADLVVMHSCDNPSCVNPGHLKLGTIQDNNLDRDTKGRKRLYSGSRHGLAKLTEKDVADIRAALGSGARKTDLAKKYNVSGFTIYYAAKIGWGHVEGQMDTRQRLTERLEAAEARANLAETRLARAVEALRPFAETDDAESSAPDDSPADPLLTVGDFRRARTVLSELESPSLSQKAGDEAPGLTGQKPRDT